MGVGQPDEWTDTKNSGFKLYILHFYKFSGALKKPVSFYVISYD